MILYPTTDNQVHCFGGTCVLLPHHITDNLTFKYHEEEHAFPYFPFFETPIVPSLTKLSNTS